jgi:polyphosphate kinase
VACPIYDKQIQHELMDMLQIQWADNTKARLINSQPVNQYRKALKGEKSIRSQFAIYSYFKDLLS